VAKIRLLVTDIDNTLFDWVTYYSVAFDALLKQLSTDVGVGYDQLAQESSAVFSAHKSIEYPFVVQELPSVIHHFGDDIDGLLNKAVRPAREAFMRAAEPHLRSYKNVKETLGTANQMGIPVIALTDAPRYVAMWKLNKLGLLDHVNAVYGLADPKIPTQNGRIKVEPEILLKHLQQVNFNYRGVIRTLPDEYEKPGYRGLKTVLMDYELEDDEEAKKNILWVGDNLRKDVGLGKRLGVHTVWAKYGTNLTPGSLQLLHKFSPLENIHKNAPIATDSVTPDTILEQGFEGLSALLVR
jgi:phosphoglycolate phosphatase